jgi:8-oxo-dGTP diphosphatase
MNTRLITQDQVSAGGVAFRRVNSKPELVIVSVKPSLRWQLPKGIVDPGETPEIAAVREVLEEAGVRTELLELLDTVEYWYQRIQYGKHIRFHKFVHFYLLQYLEGNVEDHDHEIAEARWVSFEEAIEMLAFKTERDVAAKAQELI